MESSPGTYNPKMFVKVNNLDPDISSLPLKIKIQGSPKQVHIASYYRASNQTASVINPIGEEHHQECCCTDAQGQSSRQTENQMVETSIQSKLMEMDNKESKSPLFRKKQSLFRRAIRFLITVLFITGVFYIIMTGSQYGYLDVEGIARSWDLGIPKLHFNVKCNPPV